MDKVTCLLAVIYNSNGNSNNNVLRAVTKSTSILVSIIFSCLQFAEYCALFANHYYKENISKQQFHKDMATSSVSESSLQVRLAENYNNFFHPNLCHVCKTMKLDLIECPSCHMISYCSDAHMTLHQPQHAEICGAIVKLSLSQNVKDFRGKTLEEWIKFKKDNIQNIISLLKRGLKPYEKEMFLFPKSCFKCYIQENLSPPCPKCLSVNTCNEHILIKHVCEMLSQCHILDTHKTCSDEREKIIFKKFVIYNISDCIDIRSFIEGNRQRNYIHKSQSIFDNILLSDDLSEPLTLLYAMRCANLCGPMSDSFVVHIITERPMDTRALSAWELLLHQFCTISLLSIETIALELRNESYTLQLCTDCMFQKRQFHYKSSCMLYHEYVQSSLYKRPNVIAVFNVDFSDDEASMKIIEAFQHERCPLLLTSQSKSRTENNIKIIQKTLGNIENLPFYKFNKFASDRPHRNYTTDSVMFLNESFVFYKDLIRRPNEQEYNSSQA